MSGPRGFLFIVSSPSGGGKTTLIRRLLANPPGESIRFSVSHTTRPRREGEVDGREYHFVTAAEFENMARHGEFLEHNEVHGNFYGTAKSEVLPRLAGGEDVVLDIDVQGARDIRAAYPEAISIFIVPSSVAELEHRLRERGLDGEDAIRKRLINAAKEVAQAEEFQYVIVNDDLPRAVLELESVVRASRLTPARQARALERLRKDFR
ncbi:MAG TPA: guanylate kinase [Thermoanaerobaculia bacterium]|jgi:guanylate kinase